MKKRLLAIAVALATLTAARAAPPSIFVAYPPKDYAVPFDHVLFEGSVSAGATFTIDGKSIDVGTDGLFIEWLPLKPGVNTLKLESTQGSEKTTLEYKVTSAPSAPLAATPTKINEDSIEPYDTMIYDVPDGQVVTVIFDGSPGGQASFTVGGKGPFKMLERAPENFVGLGDPKSPSAIAATAGHYEGSYLVRNSDAFDNAAIEISLTGKDGQTVKATAPAKLTVRQLSQPRVAIYTSKPDVGVIPSREVARNGPGRAYILWYLRPGMKFLITGEEGTFYQARISPGQHVYLRKDKTKILPEGAPVPRMYFTTIRTKRSGKGTQVRFELPDLAPASVRQQSAGREQYLEVKLYGVNSEVDYLIFANPDPVVRDIQWSQSEDHVFTARIDLRQAQQWGYTVTYEGNTLVLEVRDAPAIQSGRPLSGRKITIDPGHGGEDTGGAGSLRVPEKDIVLDISQRLAEKLKARGATVQLTRDKDVEVDLYARSLQAETAGSDVLLSIHANALPDGVDPACCKGSGAYYFHPQARPLADSILEGLTKTVPELGNDGVHYQNLALTRTSARPQVLVETAFLTDKGNLRLMMSPEGRDKIAEGIAVGLEGFYRSARLRAP